MTNQTDAGPVSTPAGVHVDYDPSTWLPGPAADADPAEVTGWIEGALAACASDFRVEPEAEAYQYLREMLTGFATADLACDFRFLRLRAPDDAPLVARLEIVQGAAPGQVEATVQSYDPELRPYQAPQVADIDGDLGLRRFLLFYLDRGVRSIVRYHRRIDDLGVDLVLSCAGADLKATAEGLHQLDDLARAVTVVDETGARR